MSLTTIERKRMIEVLAIGVTTLLLIGLSRLETRLFDLSETLAKNQDFFTTVVYFGLINFNVVLILILSFLIFRNVAKLVVERRRGVFGSQIRTKLVATLMFFALAPTILFFYISARFIVTSFDAWFSEKVRATMHETQEAGARVYKQDQRRLESLARIALQRVHITKSDDPYFMEHPVMSPGQLDGFDGQYGLDNIKLFDRSGHLIWASRQQSDGGFNSSRDMFVIEALDRFAKEPALWSMSTVTGEDRQDVVKGIAPILHPSTKILVGAVLTETRFETQILRSIASIQQSFANLRPGAQLIKLSYLILLIVMALLVVFSAMWLGFYVARGITGPIQSLADGTREVALGNYGIQLTPKAEDETGQLVRSFNLMTKDLERHRSEADRAQLALLKSNEELDSRRRYMEVILKHVSAGVIAVSREGRVSSVNSAAEDILSINGRSVLGKSLEQALGKTLYLAIWEPIADGIRGVHDAVSFQVEVLIEQRHLNLLVDASKIADENGEDLGLVIVLDDASEQVKLQRVAAWREVARRIAHEIKNPVTPIKLNAQRLLRRFHEHFAGEDREVFESCLESILKQVDSLRDLVNEFSKFARLPGISPKHAQLNTIILDAANLFRMSYPQLKIDTLLSAQLPELFLDTDQMNRVLVNLLANAVEAIDLSKPESAIEVSSAMLVELETVRIEVRDNGCGIPEHLKDRVLEPYFSTKDSGTGLGLAIVHQIVSDHGGYLRILENSPRGTNVVIELPIGGVGLGRMPPSRLGDGQGKV